MKLRPLFSGLAFDVLCVLALIAASLFMLFQTSCQWARVRYVDNRARGADRLVCERPDGKVNQAVDYVCREYQADHREAGVLDVRANTETRVDM